MPAEPTLGDVNYTIAPFASWGATTAAGQIMPISQNEALYCLLGMNFGGDGYQTFGLPQLIDTIAIGNNQYYVPNGTVGRIPVSPTSASSPGALGLLAEIWLEGVFPEPS